jgi:adenosylcobalamin-dependent ribonucleoside-triphosphate reductase
MTCPAGLLFIGSKSSMGNLLSKEFVSSYPERPKNAGLLFDVVYLRTYSFWLEDKKRRETWKETCQRVVEYSLSLYQGPNTNLTSEAELMFHKMFNLESMPAGRTMRIGGTPSANKFGEMTYNCAGIVVDTIDAFVDIFHMSLCSVGIGYRILKDDTGKLPQLSSKVEVEHEPYIWTTGAVKPEYRDADVFTRTDYEYRDDDTHFIRVGDSKEGWVDALRIFLRVCEHNKSPRITINYNYVRPAGERIKTAGGFAAGPEGLAEMFIMLAELITSCNGKLTPIAAMDIANSIAKNVVTGGSRRAAQISLGSPDDIEFIEAKLNLYTQNDVGEWVADSKKQHRSMSNNSVVFEHSPSLEEVQDIFKRIRNNGEPGFFNLKSARLRRPNMNTLNPCGESLMDNFGVCNLTSVVLPSHLNKDELNWDSLEESVRLATRVGLRQTNVTFSLPHWDFVQKRDRLVGVSFTGMMDCLDQMDWDFDSFAAKRLWTKMREWANNEADKYAFEMRVPRPLLVTILKPEGTISLLAGPASPGLHRAYAPHYIRRIKVSETDPVCKALMELGVPNERDKTKKDSNRWVFSFPIATGAKMAANDEPARRQFERYLILQKLYTDHNSSCTLTVGDDEWDDMAKLVHEKFDEVIACAFLSKTTHPFPQMPYEQITQEKYEEMMKTFPDLSNLAMIVNQFENERPEFDEASMDSCSGNVCPVA